MKSLKYGLAIISAIAVNSFFTACNDDSDDVAMPEVVDFEPLSTQMTNSYWSYCYDTSVGAVRVDDFSFSHSASAFEYDGVTYNEWSGFCPSKVDDITEHADDWVNNQWACMTQNPYGGIYLVGNSGSVVNEDPLSNTTCSVEMTNHGYFMPTFVYVNNSSYAYYCAKNGSAFNAAFTAQDELILNIVGVCDGAKTAHLKMPLIKNGNALTQWVGVSLESLGTVDKVLFYVDSTSKGAYGLNVPSYFCISSLGYYLPGTTTAK